jgi:hypothetical protein
MPRCPRAGRRLCVDRTTGEVFSPACGSWICPVCAHRRAARARDRLLIGLVDAVDSGRPVQLITLTCAGSTPTEALSRWSAVLRGLRYTHGSFDFAVVAHRDPRRAGWHVHALVVGCAPVRRSRLRELTSRAGVGYVHQVRMAASVEAAQRLAHYMACALARDGHAAARDLGCVRMVSYSRRWPVPEVHGMTEARRRLRAAHRDRTRRAERLRDDHRALWVLALVEEHGVCTLDSDQRERLGIDSMTEAPPPIRRRAAAMFAFLATRPRRTSDGVARAIREAAGPDLIAVGERGLALAVEVLVNGTDALAAETDEDVTALAVALREAYELPGD